MHALAYFLRGLNSITRRLAIYIRITWLRLLYPGLYIDFGSTIESNCNIKCVKGGTLKIIQSTILSGTQIISDASASIIIDRSFIGRNCVIASKKSIHIHKGCLVTDRKLLFDVEEKGWMRSHAKTRRREDAKGRRGLGGSKLWGRLFISLP